MKNPHRKKITRLLRRSLLLYSLCRVYIAPIALSSICIILIYYNVNKNIFSIEMYGDVETVLSKYGPLVIYYTQQAGSCMFINCTYTVRPMHFLS
jgi:hypothetical protein